MMLKYNVTPVIIFDGGKLKMKKDVEKDRKAKRENARKEAEAHLAAGNEEKAAGMFH